MRWGRTWERAYLLPRVACALSPGQGWWADLIKMVAVAVAYYLTGTLGLRLAMVTSSSTEVWAPTGIAIAAFLLIGSRIWPAIFAAAFLVNMSITGHYPSSLGIALGNTLEGVVAAWLVRRFANGVHAFERPWDVCKFAGLAAVASTTISATIGVTSLYVAGLTARALLGPAWLIWWLGDGGGALIVAPPIILWGVAPGIGWSRRVLLEAAAALAALGLTVLVLFGGFLGLSALHYPIHFITVPVLIWAAFRFGPREVATAIFLLAAAGLWGTIHGYGPFVQAAPDVSLLLLQTYIGVNGVVSMCLAAAVLDRRRAEEELAGMARTLEAERSQLRTILVSAGNAILHLDAATGQIMANPEAERLFGHPIVPDAGRDQYVHQIRDPEGHPVPSPDLYGSRALRGETLPSQELLIARPDGTTAPVLETAAPIRAPDGRVSGAVIVFQDIAALKELERLREEWTSVVAHDLRLPVALIHGYAELLGKEVTPDSAHRRAYCLDCIRDCAQQLNRMIADLLDVSRLEARRLALERQPVDLGDLVRDVVARAAPVTKGHPVRLTVHGVVPPVDVDPGRIEQVLVNLLSNAAKYGQKASPIEVRVGAGPSDVEIAVANRGPGIPPDELPALFARYCRSKGAREGKTPGIGLGLYIVKGLVEAHGGRIWAESVPDEDTTFRFTLPLPAAGEDHVAAIEGDWPGPVPPGGIPGVPRGAAGTRGPIGPRPRRCARSSPGSPRE